MYKLLDTKKRASIIFPIILLSFFLLTTVVLGGQYTPEGLYDPEYFTLDNGMDVVLKKRDVTHNVSIRLAVNVGEIDFPCGQKELPHFLEHLLFTGTSKHSEAELDKLIEGHGGAWSATTKQEKTIYEINIYSPNVLLAIDVLYEIFTDSLMTGENVESTRDIIHRESDGKPSSLRKWLYSHGIGRSAHVNAISALLPGSNILCPTLQTAEGITRDAIINVLKSYYVPNNMILVIVGEFDKDNIINKIKNTFGSLKRKPFNKKHRAVPPYYNGGPLEFTGIFSPLVDSEADVYIAYRTDGYLSPAIHSLTVIEFYLYTQIYNSLRIEKSLSYSPSTEQVRFDKYGLFFMSADVDLDNIDRAVDGLKQEVTILRDGKFNPDDIKQAKQNILLSWVQGFETNAGFADYYVAKQHELIMHGALIDHEERIERLTVEDISAVATRYFDESKSVIIKHRPHLTYTLFYILIAISLLMGCFIVWHLIRRVRRRR